MPFLSILNSLPWFRPALFALTGVATLLKTVTHSNTVAYHVSDLFLSYVALPAAAGSLGQSNSGSAPEKK